MFRNVDLIMSHYVQRIFSARNPFFLTKNTTNLGANKPIRSSIYYTNGASNLFGCHYRNINFNLILELVKGLSRPINFLQGPYADV